ncbi:NAD(P)-dependent oxidoreductase [Streptomyces sp. LZ34]
MQALQTGHLGFAALDVVANEPLSPDDALWNQPNVLISPHTAALTIDEGKRIIDLFVANARRIFEHQPLINTVDTVEFY